jgi:hypothetical protein
MRKHTLAVVISIWVGLFVRGLVTFHYHGQIGDIISPEAGWLSNWAQIMMTVGAMIVAWASLEYRR